MRVPQHTTPQFNGAFLCSFHCVEIICPQKFHRHSLKLIAHRLSMLHCPGAPEAYLTRSGLTRAKRRCRGRGLSRDLCLRTTMLLSNYPCTPKISSRGHHECYCTKKSEPEVLSSSNNCMYLVPRGLERPCDLLIPKCSLWEIKLDWLMWLFGKA